MEANTSTATATTGKTEAEVANKAVEKANREMAKKREYLATEYPHAMVGKNAEREGIACTLTWDAEFQKYKCQIKCVKSGKIGRWVFTSDLFQVNMCEEEAKKAKAAKKAANKALEAKAKEMIKNGEVK